MSSDRTENCRVLYEQVCTQHDGIADFRGKLLALLPIASGAGIFLLFENGGILQELSPHLIAIGLFGIAVTTGLFVYELRGIQKCNALIHAAENLEHELSYESKGAFRSRPPSIRGVGATTAALIIYPAVVGAWVYLATLAAAQKGDHVISGLTSTLISVLAAAVWAFGGWKVLNTRKLKGGFMITYDRAQSLVAGAMAKASARSLPVSVAVVDPGGYLLVFGRMEGAPLNTIEVARAKAYTAAYWGRPSGDESFAKMATERPAVFDAVKHLGMHPLFPSDGGLPLPGGGAIGVSGAPSGKQDAEIAQAALQGFTP